MRVRINPHTEYPIHCSICSCVNVHFLEPEIRFGNDNYEAGWEGRGNLITIPMACEIGHVWELCIGFHKGTSTMFIRNHSEFKDPELVKEFYEFSHHSNR